MPYVDDSEVFITIVRATGVSIILLALVVLAAVITLRLANGWRARRHHKILTYWRPILHRGLIQLIPDPPPLPRRHLVPFLELWNHLHDLVRGQAVERLNHLARKLRLDYAVISLLDHRRFRHRLLAVVSCGHLKEYGAWERLLQLLEHPNPVLSLAAARALMEIDPGQAVEQVMAKIVNREDWPAGKVATALSEAPAEVVAPALVQAVLEDPSRRAPRLIRYLGLIDHPKVQEVLASLLEQNQDEHLIALALQELRDPRYRRLVHALAHHPSWYVRVQAANALRRLGDETDIPLLAGLLGDREWWVRYRAAQAIVHLAKPEQLARLRRRLRDPYARDILEQAIAEWELRRAA